MKKFIVVVSLFLFSFSNLGCSLFNKKPPVDWAQRERDVTFFVGQATRLAIYNTKVTKDQLVEVKNYLNAARDILAVPGAPDFEAAVALATKSLSENHRNIAIVVVEVVERYVYSNLPKPQEDQVALQRLITTAIDTAVSIIEEKIK